MVDRVVKVNDRGLRIGEDHPRAQLTDLEVDRLLEMREADPKTWSYRKLARLFEISVRHVRDIINGKKRNQTAVRFRTVRLP